MSRNARKGGITLTVEIGVALELAMAFASEVGCSGNPGKESEWKKSDSGGSGG
jgi:uncharacterized membrane protein